MNRLLLFFAVFLLLAMPMQAEVEMEVEVTLSGDIDEIMAILSQLQALGIGGQSAAETPLSVEVQSVKDGALNPEAEAMPPPEPEPPRLALSNPVLPASASPGAEVALAIQVVDEDLVVDTVAARIENTAIAMDLFDNGTEGDQTAGDGVWTGRLPLPQDFSPGEYQIIFAAYDALGNPVPIIAPDGQVSSLSATVPLKVIAP